MLSVEEQNENLKRELAEIKDAQAASAQQANQAHDELSTLKARVVSLQRKIDTELGKREQVEAFTWKV